MLMLYICVIYVNILYLLYMCYVFIPYCIKNIPKYILVLAMLFTLVFQFLNNPNSAYLKKTNVKYKKLIIFVYLKCQ